MNPIRIVEYEPRFQPYFEAFNRVWIEEWFHMEAVDEWVLKNPEKAIIEPGGAILIATYEGEPAGAVGLRKQTDTCYEFTKMAVGEQFRRKGIARLLCLASFKKAAELGANEIVLYSNTKNAGAILLYEKIGFQHIPVEAGVYERANVKMRISIEDATGLVESEPDFSTIYKPSLCNQ